MLMGEDDESYRVYCNPAAMMFMIHHTLHTKMRKIDIINRGHHKNVHLGGGGFLMNHNNKKLQNDARNTTSVFYRPVGRGDSRHPPLEWIEKMEGQGANLLVYVILTVILFLWCTCSVPVGSFKPLTIYQIPNDQTKSNFFLWSIETRPLLLRANSKPTAYSGIVQAAELSTKEAGLDVLNSICANCCRQINSSARNIHDFTVADTSALLRVMQRAYKIEQERFGAPTALTMSSTPEEQEYLDNHNVLHRYFERLQLRGAAELSSGTAVLGGNNTVALCHSSDTTVPSHQKIFFYEYNLP